MLRKLANEPRFVLIAAIPLVDSVESRSKLKRPNSFTASGKRANEEKIKVFESKDNLTVPGDSIRGGHRRFQSISHRYDATLKVLSSRPHHDFIDIYIGGLIDGIGNCASYGFSGNGPCFEEFIDHL